MLTSHHREISAENLDVGVSFDSHLPIISKEHLESYDKREWNLFQSSRKIANCNDLHIYNHNRDFVSADIFLQIYFIIIQCECMYRFILNNLIYWKETISV